jgi:plastocyanin domain-containing protein
VIRGLGQRLIVRANQSATVEFTPDQPGDYRINCGMNMYVPATLRVS